MRAGRVPGRLWGEVVKAWRVNHVRRGFLGTALITIGSLTPAYLPSNSPWWTPLRWANLTGTPAKIGGTVLVVIGLALAGPVLARTRAV